MPKAYWIAQVTVTNPDQYKLYAEARLWPSRNTAPRFWHAAAGPVRWKAKDVRAMW